MISGETPEVVYRLPDSTIIMRIRQSSSSLITLNDYAEIASHTGFIVAPFRTSTECPIVIISPDKTEELNENDIETDVARLPKIVVNDADVSSNKARYESDFCRFHRQLTDNRFEKIVLARSEDMLFETPLTSNDELRQTAHKLFLKACKLYPHQFISLIIIPKIGIWLMATPEVLLSIEGNNGRSMALAGTMPFDSSCQAAEDIVWSEKNITEQHIVAEYIKRQLSDIAPQLTIDKARTVVSANVCHIRTDIHFGIDNNTDIGKIISKLHPTPAVCGLPKSDTYDFISNNETLKRQYYSGFAGTLLSKHDVNLFVSLRCMQIMNDRYRLYAGGGLLKESTKEREWNETCAKMQAMKMLIENEE